MYHRLLIVWLIVLAGGASLSGHHSFAASYFEDRTVSIEGDVTEFEYRNPHSWVHIAAPDKAGRIQKVAGEWGNPIRLKAQGIEKTSIRPGDHVIITGSPSRDESVYQIHLKRIERPADGWTWIGRGERR